MFCRTCGAQHPNPQAVMCVNCGVKKGEGENYCQACGAQTAHGTISCTNCGVAFNTPKALPNALKGLTTLMLIAWICNDVNFFVGEWLLFLPAVATLVLSIIILTKLNTIEEEYPEMKKKLYSSNLTNIIVNGLLILAYIPLLIITIATFGIGWALIWLVQLGNLGVGIWQFIIWMEMNKIVQGQSN
ncbi:MAG: hypothetical protein FWG45_06040 [Oscillospiraceae bacterium]|nr:hypothetical protein [Oscillospiraceae bacterium]